MKRGQKFGDDEMVYIHNGRKLAVVNGNFLSWTANIRKATRLPYAKAVAFMKNRDVDDLWYEAAPPFNAIVRFTRGSQVLYLEKTTSRGMLLSRSKDDAHRYKNAASAAGAIGKRTTKEALAKAGFVAEIVILDD